MPLPTLLRLILRDIPRVAIGLVLLAAIAINFANIVGRYVFLAPLPWAEEVLSFIIIWGVMVGASAVTFDRRHLAVDLFVGSFPPAIRRAVDVLTLLLLIGFSGFACLQAWTIVTLMASNGQVSITAGIPMTIPYFAFVTGFALIAIAGVTEAVLRWRAERDATRAAAGR
jgi:TRAP-type C4-dicarboxylate transport system permease small subunit